MAPLKMLARTLLLLTFGVATCVLAQEDSVRDIQVIEEAEVFSQAELDQMLAPIALYPDTLLSHILIASTYPLEVVQAQRWSKSNGSPQGDEALNAVDSQDWDPSVKALVAFPRILTQMSTDIGWMQRLGDAFLQDEGQVLASVQQLRQRARDQGSLSDLDHFVVEDEDDNIVIESRVKEVVYVPYYDTRVVYGGWWWNTHPPIYWALTPGISFYWGPRIHVGARFYFSSFHWHKRHVVVIDHRHYHHRRFYSGRHVVRHVDSRRWVHNPTHRRGARYRSTVVRDRHDARYRHNTHAIRQTRSASSGRTAAVTSQNQRSRDQVRSDVRDNRTISARERDANSTQARLQGSNRTISTRDHSSARRTQEQLRQQRQSSDRVASQSSNVERRDYSRPSTSTSRNTNTVRTTQKNNTMKYERNTATKTESRQSRDYKQQKTSSRNFTSSNRSSRSDSSARSSSRSYKSQSSNSSRSSRSNNTRER